MKPTYEVRAWREHSWWLARVLGANDCADPTPIGAMAHTRALTTVEQTVRDLIATILDVDERTQRPHTPRGTRLLADARGRDDGVRQELAERLSVRSAAPTRKVVVSDQSCACLR